MRTHVNGKKLATLPPAVTGRVIPGPPPACPKRCDVSTPPEHLGGDQFVCVCCGTEFTWRANP